MRDLDVLIVGAGFGGLAMLHKARAKGLVARAVDAAPSVGGTWYHNRYPGARVDIQSLEYSFSFDPALQQEWRWQERYAGAPELLRYANHVADRFGLREHIELGTRLVEAHWDDAASRWQARTDDGRRWSARFLVMASGALSTPNTPAFEGLDAFEGRLLHTADWPHDGVDLRGQRVGVIGTGSSGVQVIPRLAEQAAHLTVFQRTAAYVVPAHNGPLDIALEARVKADYDGFRARQRRMPGGLGSEHPPYRVSALAVSDAERRERFEERWRVGGFVFLTTFYDILLDARANALAAEFVRDKIRATVRDPAVAERLCPRQPLGCKRLCVDSSEQGYYATFNRPGVELVDVQAVPIARLVPHGLVLADGREHRLDAIVFATGFDAITGTLTRIDLRGRDGQTMRDKWAAGPLNYLGLMTAGFPNLFHVAGAGSTAAFTTVTLAIEHHVDWIADCIGWLGEHGRTRIEARADAERDWMAYLLEMAGRTVFLSCDSWYLGANIPGKPRVFAPLTSGFPGYAERCAQVAAEGYAGFDLA